MVNKSELLITVPRERGKNDPVILEICDTYGLVILGSVANTYKVQANGVEQFVGPLISQIESHFPGVAVDQNTNSYRAQD